MQSTVTDRWERAQFVILFSLQLTRRSLRGYGYASAPIDSGDI